RAEPLFREILEQHRKKKEAESVNFANLLTFLGLNLLHQRKYREAELVMRESLAIREKIAPDAWETFTTASVLGGTLLSQKKYVEAEQHLVKGYEGMKQREAKMPASSKTRLIEALERLVALYEATDRPEQAAAWRQQLDAAKKALAVEKQP